MPNTSNVYPNGLAHFLAAGDFLADTMKAPLIRDTYVANVDHDFMSSITEIANVTGYVGGFGGSGRITLASKTLVASDADDALIADAADVSYGTLATGTTIGGAGVIKEITNDAASPILARCGTPDTPTNGAAVTFQFDAQGIFRITCAVA